MAYSKFSKISHDQYKPYLDRQKRETSSEASIDSGEDYLARKYWAIDTLGKDKWEKARNEYIQLEKKRCSEMNRILSNSEFYNHLKNSGKKDSAEKYKKRLRLALDKNTDIFTDEIDWMFGISYEDRKKHRIETLY